MVYEDKKPLYGKKLEYKKYRVKSPIKSFRDLEVYKKTTQLAAGIFRIKLDEQGKAFEKELENLQGLDKPIPELIAESFRR